MKDSFQVFEQDDGQIRIRFVNRPADGNWYFTINLGEAEELSEKLGEILYGDNAV